MMVTIAAAGLAVAAYIALAVLAWALQDLLVFPRGSAVWSTPGDMGWEYDDVRMDVEGEQTHGWFIPVPDSRGVLLFSHGNAGCIADRLESIAQFRALGLDVFIYDYGGYGSSTGQPSEQRCYADVRAAWRYLTGERGIAPERIVLFGRSLGGGPAADLATEVRPAAVILESTFTSAVRLGQQRFPILPVGRFLRHRFDNAAKVPRTQAPVCIVHSPDDEIVPYAHGRELYELAPEPKTFLEIRGRHNTGFLDSEPEYLKGLRRFLEPLLPAPPDAGAAR